MQHYGLPTRLLDLTFNPLVALYFACQNGEKAGDGEFITITLSESSIKYFDSDTISCVANLSSLTGKQRNEIRRFKNAEQLKKSVVGLRLLHFIKSEKPYFLPKIKLEHLRGTFVVRPKQTNNRILAQQGAFLIFGLSPPLRPNNGSGIIIKRVSISADKKKALLEELDKVNINGKMLFPEIESAAKYLTDKIPLDTKEDEDT